MNSGPVAQFNPIESKSACIMETAKDSAVWPASIVPSVSIVPETMIGTLDPISSKSLQIPINAAFTLRVYAHAMRRDVGDKEALKALVEGGHWAPLGTSGADDPSKPAQEVDPENDESPAAAGLPEDGRGGFRTCDLSRVKRDQGDCEEPPQQGRLF